MKKLFLVITCCIMAGCSGGEKTAATNEHGFGCGPIALATYSRIVGRDGGSGFAVRIKEFYKIIGKQEGVAVNMLDLRNAASVCGFTAEPRLLTMPQATDMEGYAIIYTPHPLPKGAGRLDPASIGHFILVRFSNGAILGIDPSTLEETEIDFDIRSDNLPVFALILQGKSA